MQYSYHIIEPNEKLDVSEFNTGKDIYIKIIYDNKFMCEDYTGVIKYKNSTKIYAVGREINIIDSKFVIFRISRTDYILRQVFEILPLITYHIYGKQTALIHGAGLAMDNMGILCVGPSGSGKTTLSNMATQHGFEILSDELIIYSFETNSMYGTPIVSNDYLGSVVLDKQVLLKRIMCLHKADRWTVENYQLSKVSKVFELINFFKFNQYTIESVQQMSKRIDIKKLLFTKTEFQGEIILYD